MHRGEVMISVSWSAGANGKKSKKKREKL